MSVARVGVALEAEAGNDQASRDRGLADALRPADVDGDDGPRLTT